MQDDRTSTDSKSKWPSGMTFVLYCGGISLLLLTAYVIFSKKDFEIDATKGILKSGLTPQGVSAEAAKDKSADLKQQFEIAKSQSEPTIGVQNPADISGQGAGSSSNQSRAISFTGSWTGNGSTYTLEQHGSKVLLAEMTNGIVTAYGEGTANGSKATLTVQTALLPISIEMTMQDNRHISVSGAASFEMDPI